MLYADVLIENAAGKAFTYKVPGELEDSVRPGVWVESPFGRSGRLKRGIVLSVSPSCDVDGQRLKEISGLSGDMSTLSSELMELAAEIADEYCSTLAQAISTVQPVRKKVRPNRRRRDPVEDILSSYSGGSEEFSLSPLQQEAADAIEQETRVSLLYGVTGSGKTRVYIELIRRMAARGLQTIVLVPEIALTYQTVGEMATYLGDRVAVMHSRLSQGERYEQFQLAEQGEIDVIVGPRSAVFAPFGRLGLIIIDEEHERSYHSDTTPTYDARWVAAARARIAGAKLLLASATPSMESYYRALSGEYALHTLSARAAENVALPSVSIVDMRTELASGHRGILSRELLGAIEDRLTAGEQVMLFLNRRGYSGFVSCRSCGEALKCPHCDVTLTVHNAWYRDPVTGVRSARLECHYCGYTTGLPGTCPSCGSSYLARFGIGTEQLEAYTARMFPAARILRMDADTVTRKGSYEAILSAMRKRRADILIGTQMIVKGHDFPFVTLVGIVAADLSLCLPDYDAAERTFQLITQAAGRSGRGERAGSVIIQSYSPEHYAIECAARQDYPGFYERELSYRRLLAYPPLTEMLSLRLRSEDEALAGEASEYAGEVLRSQGLEVFGPMPESIYKINNSYRKILYVKHPEHDIIKKALADTLAALYERFPTRRLIVSSELR